MIDTRLIGPKDDQYAVLSLGTVWLATTKKPYAEAVSAAVAAAIAGGGATDAAPSATAAPVAWLIKYDAAPNTGQMQQITHGHNAIGDYRQIDPAATSTPLYSAPQSLQVEEGATDPMENWLMRGALEWLEQAEHGGEKERCKNIAVLLRTLWRGDKQNLQPVAPGSSYMKGEPAPTGCGAIFKESEGWSCDCERAHPAPCKANASPTTQEQPK